MSLLESFLSSQKKTQHSQASAKRLRTHVERLTQTTVPRTFNQSEGLEEAGAYIASAWEIEGLKAERQSFKAGGRTYANLFTSLNPANGSRLVIGAHYDVAGDQNPGADDNASGVAGLLELARLLRPLSHELKYRVDLVAFCLEEPPFFGGPEMGSAVYARSLKDAGIKVELMLSLEMIGYFTEAEGSQGFPHPALKAFYPTRGNFIGVVGNMDSVDIIKRVRNLMDLGSRIDVQLINAPQSVTGIDLSDHRSFWDAGFQALMITDTAFFRNPHYHTANDKPETLNYDKMAEVVNGVANVVLRFDSGS